MRRVLYSALDRQLTPKESKALEQLVQKTDRVRNNCNLNWYGSSRSDVKKLTTSFNNLVKTIHIAPFNNKGKLNPNFIKLVAITASSINPTGANMGADPLTRSFTEQVIKNTYKHNKGKTHVLPKDIQAALKHVKQHTAQLTKSSHTRPAPSAPSYLEVATPSTEQLVKQAVLIKKMTNDWSEHTGRSPRAPLVPTRPAPEPPGLASQRSRARPTSAPPPPPQESLATPTRRAPAPPGSALRQESLTPTRPAPRQPGPPESTNL